MFRFTLKLGANTLKLEFSLFEYIFEIKVQLEVNTVQLEVNPIDFLHMRKTHKNETKNVEVDNCTIDREIILKRASLGGSESLNRILHGVCMSEYPFSLYEGRELAHISVQVV